MESSDQDVAQQQPETPKAETGKTDRSLRAVRSDLLTESLERTGLSRADIGRLVGVAPSTVYRWGRHTPAPKGVIAFLRLYEAWAAEEDLISKAVELLDGGGTRNQVARNLKAALQLRDKAEKFLSEMP